MLEEGLETVYFDELVAPLNKLQMLRTHEGYLTRYLDEVFTFASTNLFIVMLAKYGVEIDVAEGTFSLLLGKVILHIPYPLFLPITEVPEASIHSPGFVGCQLLLYNINHLLITLVFSPLDHVGLEDNEGHALESGMSLPLNLSGHGLELVLELLLDPQYLKDAFL